MFSLFWNFETAVNALSHSDLRHWEMAYKMIDEDVAYSSQSSVYRILRAEHLIPLRQCRIKPDN